MEVIKKYKEIKNLSLSPREQSTVYLCNQGSLIKRPFLIIHTASGFSIKKAPKLNSKGCHEVYLGDSDHGQVYVETSWRNSEHTFCYNSKTRKTRESSNRFCKLRELKIKTSAPQDFDKDKLNEFLIH